MQYNRIFSLILLTILVIIAFIVAWASIDVLLLAFAGIILALALETPARRISERFNWSYPVALTAFLATVSGILVLTFWLYAPLITEQVEDLFEQLPTAALKLKENVEQYVKIPPVTGAQLKDLFSNEKILEQVTRIFSGTLGGLISFFVFIILGLYIAYNPEMYVKAFLQVIPPKKRKKVEEVFETAGRSLRWWVLGKFISMLAIGILTFFGLWMLGVSLAFILGLLSGILAFIPYIGPILAAIPAVLIAFTQSPLKAVYVVLLYVGVHIIEGYFMTPFIERKTVLIPPALTIFMQVLLIVLVGGWGLALASPLTVVFLIFLHYAYGEKSAQGLRINN